MHDHEKNRQIKIVYIERKYWKKDFFSFSLEKIFEEVGRLLNRDTFCVEYKKLPYGNSMFDVLKNLIYFRPAVKDQIIHITGHVHYMALVFPRRTTILTIHDLIFLKGNAKRGLTRSIIKKLFLDLPVRRLKYITTVSETIKKAIIHETNCEPEKIRVIENPVQEHYLNSQPKGFNKECPTLLQVGITHNKNILRLIMALNGIKCRLKIVGNETSELVSALNAAKIDHEFVFGLSNLEMRQAYQTADIVTFCSTYEGFGLPIVEGQAMNTPVITSDISPMNDVAGGGAVLVDPLNVDSIRDGILSIINDDDLRRLIIEKGSKNVMKYQPSAVARKYESLYREVASQL